MIKAASNRTGSTSRFVVLFWALVFTFHFQADTGAAEIPADVKSFKEKRDLCDHFRGEDPYDAERRQFLIDNIDKYCTGSDRELARLKAKYRSNEAIIRMLSEYEEKIEAAE